MSGNQAIGRLMLAFALAIAVSEGVSAQLPYSAREPVTSLGRYHGIGFGPGYHNTYPSTRAPRWHRHPPAPKPLVAPATPGGRPSPWLNYPTPYRHSPHR